jgi:hypothetical protein
VNQLLPHLLAPGRRIDLTALAERRPAAVANWLQGEREYRRANFASALEYLRRAVAADTALALAALRGAQAADWMHQFPEEGALIRVALAHVDVLSARQAHFARGLAASLAGQPDSAVLWLTRALADAPDWTEAHMALGEVYYHLLPSNVAPLGSLAETEFRAAASDTGFTPPLYHLAQIAIRSGDAARAARAVRQFERSGLDPDLSSELALTLACVEGDRGDVPWGPAVATGALAPYAAARSLAAAGAYPACAEDGFRALLATRDAAAFHWGAFLGLQGVLAAEGRTSELRALIDSLVAGGIESASWLYLLDANGGVAVHARAAETAERYAHRFGPHYVGVKPQMRWLLGSWYARNRDAAAADGMRRTLVEEAARTGDPRTTGLAAALTGQLAALRGDTASAIALLRTVISSGRRELLQWDLSEPFPRERLLLAELLLARGQAHAAMVVAAAFDQSDPVAFLPYLPASLVLRHRAALAMGQATVAKQLRDRLVALGQGSLLAVR